MSPASPAKPSPSGRASSSPEPPPSGLVAVLFTDVVGSTALKQQLGDRGSVALLTEHHALVRQTLSRFPGGQEIETAGDSFLIVFTAPSAAVQFALELQAGLKRLAQTNGVAVRDRIGIHVGEVVMRPDARGVKPRELYGMQVDICARVMSLAQGGQILMTRFAFDNARQILRGQDLEALGPVQWLNHGPYLFKGLEEPLEVCEVRLGAAEAVTPPPSTEKAQRCGSLREEPVLGWRPAAGQAVPGTAWTLAAKLGEGGFGEVWLAEHRKLKEHRVFKFCFRADRVRALKREITLFRVLRERVGEHPHLVRLLEVNLEHAPFYLQAEYVPGRDLRTWCEGQGGIVQVPPATRLEIIAQVAEGLAAAHAAGVLHRDIKPTNILISEPAPGVSQQRSAGEEPAQVTGAGLTQRLNSLAAKLTDFGIGQVVSAECLTGVTAAGFTQTVAANAASSPTGTQAYMAPEVLMGQPASVSSDLYSLGVVLYQLLAGDFARPVTTDWARDINDPLLQEDLQRCFAGKLEERFGSAADLARNLRSLSQRRSSRAAASKRAFEQGTARVASLAVLPFVNMSADPENEFLSAGISEDLITALARVPGLRVPARTSAFAFKGKEEDIRVIGQMLNVETVLEGSVRQAGNRLRVTAQLINVADGFHLWSERYDQEMADVFAIQDEITQAIVGALKPRLAGGPAAAPVKRHTANTEAYQLYLKGRFLIAKLTPEGLGMGMRLLEQAINLEPDYPLPYVTQALAYWVLAHFGFLPPKEGMPKSQAAALRALALDETLAEAHTQLALTRFMYDWDWAGAEAEFRRALELDPRSAEARHWYGVFLWAMSRLEEALAEIGQAVELDPLSLATNMDFAFPLISLGRCPEAIAHAEKLIGFEPQFWGGYRVRGLANKAAGQTDAAIADLEKAVALGGGPFMLAPLGSILAKSGRVAEARRILEQLNELARTRYVPTFCWILIYAGLGDRAQLQTWWDRGIAERDASLACFRVVAQTWWPDNTDLPLLLKKIGL